MLKDIFQVLGRAIGSTLRNLHIVLPVILIPALFLGVLDTVVFNALDIDRNAVDANMQIIKVAMAWTGNSLLTEIFYGPIVVATAVYVGRGGESLSLYKALNFALNRYRRLFKWHAAAYMLINLGMIVILPGILYTLSYAFVDSVCCIEDEKWPLARSKKLTRGRRKRIFFIFLPFFIWTQVAMFFYLAVIEGSSGWLAVGGIHLVVSFVLFVFYVAMYVMYEARTTAPKKKKKVIEAAS